MSSTPPWTALADDAVSSLDGPLLLQQASHPPTSTDAAAFATRIRSIVASACLLGPLTRVDHGQGQGRTRAMRAAFGLAQSGTHQPHEVPRKESLAPKHDHYESEQVLSGIAGEHTAHSETEIAHAGRNGQLGQERLPTHDASTCSA